MHGGLSVCPQLLNRSLQQQHSGVFVGCLDRGGAGGWVNRGRGEAGASRWSHLEHGVEPSPLTPALDSTHVSSQIHCGQFSESLYVFIGKRFFFNLSRKHIFLFSRELGENILM